MKRLQSLPRLRPTLGVVAVAAALVACGPSGGGGGEEEAGATIIQNKGSDTMVNVAQVWAEKYRAVAPDVEVEVSGGGSGVGLAALIRGAVDVANASRDMKPQEMEAAEKNTGKTPKEFTVGYDALAVYVHKDNPLNEIDLPTLAEIYVEGGTVTRWSQIGVTIPGVSDDTIVRVSRQSSSGTYEFFRDHVLQKRDFALGSRDLNGSKEVVELVSSTPTAIGYSGMGYATEHVKMLRLASEAGGESFEPSVENTNNRTYPLARSLHLYTLGEPEGALKAYIEWILSPAGQKVVEDSGYVPLATSESEPAPEPETEPTED
ncbi:MAG: PstS family phosphate ABC transporter substrate-binding protein [Acidobacteria bacterium]|jgi:phosphate transport system substrate-binding protein|nr:PstS family phosphate ABC transporter substrate-binding protein [Acidobacteriota bacterium]